MTQALNYKEKFRQMDREALATTVCAVVITLFFWGAIFLFKDSPAEIMTMPLWFVISCLGGYLLSVVGVIFIVRVIFKDFELDDKDESAEDKQ